MDQDQAARTIKWLDEERRKDKAELSALQERLVNLENTLASRFKRVQELDGSIAGLAASLQRFSRFEEALDKLKADFVRQIETIEARRANSEREQDKLRAVEREGINKSLIELRKAVEPLPHLQKEMPARREEENRLTRELRELEQKVADFTTLDEERGRSQAMLEESRRQESRRITDLQSETGDLRRKIDELRPKLDILEDPIRRLEARVNEVIQAEGDRRTQQIAFIEHQEVVNAERERQWSEWQTRLDALRAEAEDFARQMEGYGENYRAVKKTVEGFQASLDRLERRINEAGEMQRLAEDRFRQEWAAFQADEQKRWTTHMLMRDEQWRESDRHFQKLVERMAAVEEQMIEVQELVRDLPENDQRRLESLLALIREWVAEHEQSFAQVR